MLWMKSRRVRVLLGTVTVLFLCFALLRAIFLFGFSEVGDTVDVKLPVLLKTLSIGLRFDLRLAILMVTPLFVLSLLPRFNVVSFPLIRKLCVAYLSALVSATLLFYIIDFGHYAYLGIRIDSSVLRFLDDLAISQQMVWETYPVIWITIGWLCTSAAMAWLINRIFLHAASLTAPNYTRLQYITNGVLVFVVGFALAFGRFSEVPLRWNNAFFSGNTVVGALGLNPVLYFFDTLQFGESNYDFAEVKKYYPVIAEYLSVDNPLSPEQLAAAKILHYKRHFSGENDHTIVKPGERPPNVVFIMLESLGTCRLGIFNNPLQPTPVLDDMARNGWLFSNFFVPAAATAKTVFGSITGLADVSTYKSATRNPLIADQNTVINAFKNYKKYYFIGGSAGWANMRALIELSIDGVDLHEEGSFTEPTVDVWGLSDLGLFREADKVFSKLPKDQPFFAYVQTASNHRPFTIPDDNDGFEVKNPGEDVVHDASFLNVEQYNATRFLDHNIGRFLQMAKDSGYFENTIFVLFGDHNDRISHAPFNRKFLEALNVERLHVPHIIYAPKYLKPRLIEDAASLLDMAPTVAGLVGVPYTNYTMGRDFNNPYPEQERMVLTLRDDKRWPTIGAISKDFMLQVKYDSSETSLHDLHSDDPKKDVSELYPERAEYMTKLARGMYETTKYLHYHNAPDENNKP